MGYATHLVPAYNQRSAQRYPIRFPAGIIVARKRTAVEVRDISSCGALLYLATPPARGTEVVFVGIAFEVVATVAWQTDGACGLNFHRAVDPLEIVRKNVAEMERFGPLGAGRRAALEG